MKTIDKREFSYQNLKSWFEREKRIFPWRGNPTPYAVWVSEVMLQQTRASVVVDYFTRWMARFPTIESLATAPLDEVIKIWEGLGYYSRARNLHEGAKYLVTYHNGTLPSDAKALSKVKGLGPYTIGAILSFAFHKKAAAVDGNVLRVIARLFALEEEIDQPASQKWIRQRVEELLPDTEPWVIMEALIELGATLCVKKPACEVCPLQENCKGYLLGKAEELPKRKKRAQTIFLNRIVPVIYHKQEFLIQKQEGKKVMAGLFEFPYFEEETQFESFYPGKLQKVGPLSEVKHTFTRYRARLIPTLWEAEVKMRIEGYIWVEKEKLRELPFSSGHRKITQEVMNHADPTYRKF
ncbi:MAG: A/G-specific adenine glycosylase [Simkaniaceae bacterium]|nr:A/G-specific adenine glycosylase [Candidatus Sacchlamyda saccharinae]